ncbi:glycosyltransferase family 2 protein [Tuberibacillus sp. Marseille-P3662]|uniref:glycosyltransferase family 2 protein n=1 Tax=Tuberibacillus sp. Marseille-P3662 TaxID=1965358 RepID=UPI0020CAA97F|nr:glycosyltransferase family 2 protein [Tuberibacillus sp. Marseille-P3662]
MTTTSYKPDISVVAPVYGCASCLKELYQRLRNTLEPITPHFEVILVNDQSPDEAWPVMQQLCDQDIRIKAIALSRNFGQHHAITAGLDYTKGDWVVVMDCDLQDQPEEIPKLYEQAQTGYDIVFARRTERKDRFFKRLSSKMFYALYSYLTDEPFDHTIANFSICSRQVINEVITLREQSRSYPLSLKWLGFRWTAVNVEHAERHSGQSSYSLKKLLRFALDSITSQSNKPLRLSIKFGFMVALISFLYGCFLIYKYLFLYQPVAGWTSVMVSIYFIGGLLFANLGIIGLYIGKVFDETKARPLYVIRSKIGFDEEPVRMLKQKGERYEQSD